MKARYDFVSNSSSSSFVICGVTYGEEFVKKVNLSKEEKKSYDDGELSVYDIFDKLYDMCDKAGLTIESEGYDDIEGICIGLDMHEMKDNETLGDFKKKAVEKLKSIGFNAKIKDVHVVSGGSDASGLSFFESRG